MINVSEQHVETITQDLQCPQCEYNLRGLQGAFVACPECGLEVDVAKLVAERWEKPWYRAPGFSYITSTVGVGMLCLPGILLLFGLSAELLDNGWRSFDLKGMVGLAVVMSAAPLLWWIARLWKISRKWSNVAVLHALLAHVLFAGYFVCGVLTLVALFSPFGGGSLSDVPYSLVIAGIVFAVFWGCRRGERYIAEQCIRRHLAGRVTIAPTETN